jgi:hypothetical protein
MDSLDLPPRPLQLPLPFAVPAASPSPPPLAAVVIRPRTLWRRLPPAQQAQVRQTLTRICREVLDDPAEC